jgi:hypothetical protein
VDKKKFKHMQTVIKNMQEIGFVLLHEAAQNFVYQIYSRVENKKKYYAGSGSRTTSA